MPFRPNCRAVSSPMPLLAPVIKAVEVDFMAVRCANGIEIVRIVARDNNFIRLGCLLEELVGLLGLRDA